MIGVLRTEPEGLEMEDLGRRLWAVFLDRHFKPEAVPPAVDMVEAGEIEELIFSFLPTFRPQIRAMDGVPFDRAHDSEADQALEWLALDGSTRRWSELSPGAWRVLLERLSFSIFALEMTQLSEEQFTIPLPRHATKLQRATATLLAVLGTFGRNLPPEWPGQSPLSLQRLVQPAPSTRQ